MTRLLGRLMLVALALSFFTDAASARRHRHHRHHGLRITRIVVQPEAPSFLRRLFGSATSLVDAAELHLGATAGQLGLPRSLWCADFMNQTLRRAGYQGTGSRAARSFLALPHVAPSVGAIAVLTRKGGGHVGIVKGFEGGDPILVSGNHGGRVGEGVYPASRVIAYVSPR